jgi:NADPH-dependent F420 reductase
MKIGIVGGTGDIGEGIAVRLSPLYDVVIGSRDEVKAAEAGQCCTDLLKARGISCSCSGVSNQQAVDDTDVVILAIPFRHLEPTLGGLTGFKDKIVVSPVNPMEKRDFFTFIPPAEGSAALMAKRLLPDGTRLVTAFNTVAANRWKAVDEELDYAIPVCSDDQEAKVTVMGIINRISKLKAFDAGPLAASPMVECITPLLLNIARFNKMRDVGIRFV